MKTKTGLHLREATDWTFHLYRGENKIAEIFSDAVFTSSNNDCMGLPTNLKDFNKAVRLINKAAKETAKRLTNTTL